MSSRGRRSGGFTLTQPLRPGQMYLCSIYSLTHSRISRIPSAPWLKETLFVSLRRVMLKGGCRWVAGNLTPARSLNLMGSVNLDLEIITDVDKALGPENLDERCLCVTFPSVFGLNTFCFVVVKLSLNCGKRNLKHLGILSLAGNRFCYWKFRMTVVRFLTLTGGSGLSLCVVCVDNWKTLDCIILSVGFLRISLNSVRVSQFTKNLEQELLDDLVSGNMYALGTYSCFLEDIYVRSLLLPLGNNFVTSSLWVLLCSKFFLFHSELARCSGPWSWGGGQVTSGN